MCGIIGGWLPDSATKPNFKLGLDKLRHRGPNDTGLESFPAIAGEIIFGHTRLSIIDLSDAGHQPMHSTCGRYTIVFNGEIYNYRELRQQLQQRGMQFITDSDTEVLLACWAVWGEDCLQRLQGMFAFALFDRLRQQIVCVRDAFGIKPLFYRHDAGGFFYASELPALLSLGHQHNKPNYKSAYMYLVEGCYDQGGETFFHNVSQLLPGHILTLDLNTGGPLSIHRWWWPSIVEQNSISFSDASEQLRIMFLDSIRMHLRSDVSLGAALSGGLDSSAVVCAMRHVEPDIPIHTFSYVARGSALDEEHWADLVNVHVGATPHKVFVRPGELAGDLDDLILTQGEPFGSTSIYAQYRVFKLAREHGVTVTLDGQGADELLAGYRGYPGPRLHSYVDRGELIELAQFLQAWSDWPGRSLSFGIKAMLGEFVPTPLRGLALKSIGRDPRPKWIDTSFFKTPGISPSSSDPYQDLYSAHGRRLVSALRKTLTGHGLTSLLRHGDRNSMRWSVESRVPFLNHNIAQFLLGLPENYLISGHGETKHVFRAAMRDIVPATILERRDKIGFSTPERAWLCQLGDQVYDWLEAADGLPFLHASRCRAEVEAIIGGLRPFDFRAWRLINYCRWSQLFEVSC